MSIFFALLGVLVLVLLNGYFVAAEYALVTVRRTRLHELERLGRRRAKLVLRLTEEPARFIAAMQLGVTATSLAIGALGEPALAEAFGRIPGTALAIVLAFLIITFLHVVIGELVPKGLALGHAEQTALSVAVPVRAFFVVFKPLIWFLQGSSEVTLRALGLHAPGAEDTVYSEVELRMLLERSTEEGELEEEEQEMLYKVFDFADKEASDVMVPRPQVVALSIDLPIERCLETVLASPYTRFPVYRGDVDQIAGILHVRDLFNAIVNRGAEHVQVEDLLRDAYVVPETKDIAALLREFRHTNQHMAIVVDEYGEMEGIVTLEDVLEEIVGEIEDEFDLPDESVEQVDEHTMRVAGTYPIDDFNEQFGTDFPVEDFHTMGGYVFGLLGRGAEVGDEVAADGTEFLVLEVEGQRILRIQVRLPEEDVGPDGGDPERTDD